MLNRKNRIFIMSKKVYDLAKQSLQKRRNKSKRRYIFTEVISRIPKVNNEDKCKNQIQPHFQPQPLKNQNNNNLLHSTKVEIKEQLQSKSKEKSNYQLQKDQQISKTKRLNKFLQLMSNKQKQQDKRRLKSRIFNKQSLSHRRIFTLSEKHKGFQQRKSNNEVKHSISKPRRRIFSDISKKLAPQLKNQHQIIIAPKSTIKEQQQKDFSKIQFSKQNKNLNQGYKKHQ